MVKKILKKIGSAVFGKKQKKKDPPPAAAGKKAGGKKHPASSSRRAHSRRDSGTSRKPAKPWSLDQFIVPEKEGETRFHDIGIPDEIMHSIADLGFEYCTPIQAKVLPHAKSGQNVAARAQTGTGKTAAFLISIFGRFLMNPIKGKRASGTPRALVIAPTRELVIQIAKDAKDLSKHCGFSCVAVYGGMDFDKQERELTRGPVELIAATPGRLLDFVNRKIIDLSKTEVLIIDEADRMLDMGFIPDVKRILRHTPAKNQRRTMLFSATLTDDVLRLASQWMPDPIICEVNVEQVAVETVDKIVYIVTSREKFALLYNLLQERKGQKVLIFGNRRDRTERLANKLNDHGVSCELLSGAVHQKKRLRILDDFKSGKTKVVVATDVAGRGLHVDDIALVVNYEFPYEAEDFVHRIGRTGRAGAEGTAVSFACESESFIIPDIEEYIGEPLPCIMPGEKLLKSPPRPERQPRPERRERQERPHRDRRRRS